MMARAEPSDPPDLCRLTNVAIARYNSISVMNNLRGDTMRWLQGEPTLEDVLSDPTVHVLMERDDVDPDDLRALLENVRTTLEGRI
jgi:hypothetical protein